MKSTRLRYLFTAIALIMLLYIWQTNSILTEGIIRFPNSINNEKSTGKSQHIIVGYYPAWKSYEGYTPDKVDVSKLTHINYAFANIGADYRISMGYPDKDPANFEMFKELKKINPDLKILISVGGWNWSGKFSDMAATEENRNAFADSCVEFITEYGLDGVDLDWEYPVGGGLETNSRSTDDKQNFTLLLCNIREKLNAQGLKDNKKYLLTIAAGASNYYIGNMEVDKFHNYLDFVNLMTYDINGPWDSYFDFNSPLYGSGDDKTSIDSCVKAWLNAGLPADKLIMGIPFYGYKYDLSGTFDDGIRQKHMGGSALSYETIVKDYLSNPRYTKKFHEESLVPWLYDGETFISYDDPQSVALKAEYIRKKNLGGAMVWELSQDSKGTLLNSMYEELNSVLSNDYKGHWAEDVIQKWLDMKYIAGYPDGTFRPNAFITRAEFVKMTNNLFGFSETAEIAFGDVAKDSWYYGEIQKAYKAGYIKGISAVQFAPDNYITREQSAAIISRLLKLEGNDTAFGIFYDSSQISGWAKGSVGAVAANSLIMGYEDNTFRPINNIKRAEAVALLNRILK